MSMPSFMKVTMIIPLVLGGFEAAIAAGETIETTTQIAEELIRNNLAVRVKETAVKGSRRTACQSQLQVESQTHQLPL